MDVKLEQDQVIRIGTTTAEPVIKLYYSGDWPNCPKGEDFAPIDELLRLNEGTLEEVYPTKAGASEPVEPITWDRRSPAVFDGEIARPRVVIPVFPGTNCEYSLFYTSPSPRDRQKSRLPSSA